MFSEEMMAALRLEDDLDQRYADSVDILGYDNTHSRDCFMWYGPDKSCTCRLRRLSEDSEGDPYKKEN